MYRSAKVKDSQVHLKNQVVECHGEMRLIIKLP